MADRKRCFVVISFGILNPPAWMSQTLDKYLAVIGPALEQCGHLLSPAWQGEAA
jgi:hypothetical protein